jgi:nicotinamide riboside kinase
MSRKTIVINLLSGPGAGKSTIAASVFSELKWRGVEAELVTEYAKDKVWEEATKILENQLYIFAKQEQRTNRLNGKVDVILTDSSILLTLAYVKSKVHKGSLFKDLVLEEFDKYDNMNYLLRRNDMYVQNGRNQTFEQAKEKDRVVENILHENNIEYEEVDFNRDTVDYIVNQIMERLENGAE